MQEDALRSLAIELVVTVCGFPKIRGTFLGIPIIRTIVYWGLYWGSLILGNYRNETGTNENHVIATTR